MLRSEAVSLAGSRAGYKIKLKPEQRLLRWCHPGRGPWPAVSACIAPAPTLKCWLSMEPSR